MNSALVLGGGFSGIEAAIQLRQAGLEVTLVSNRPFVFINPIAIWIPTGELPFEQATVPLDELARVHGFTFRQASVLEVRSAENKVLLSDGELEYDYLVVAMGASKLKPRGVEHTRSICAGPDEVRELGDLLQALVAKGQGSIAMGFGGNPKDPSAVRGGPVFELLFNVHNMLEKRGVREHFKITFFAPMEKPGQKMGEGTLEMMDKMFERSSIEKRVGTAIAGFEEQGVAFADGSRLDADLVLFTPGVTGHPVLGKSDLPLSPAGFVLIDDHCLVQGTERVYAVGDIASLEGPEWRAKQGHVAEVMARNVAFNIASHARGSQERKGYAEHLGILCVMDTGNGAAWIQRDARSSKIIPMPVIGHWLKKAWASYWKLSRRGKLPRLPGV